MTKVNLSDDPSYGRLKLIADRLGLPVDLFFDPDWLRGQAVTAECLRICCGLKTEDGRLRALTSLRAILEDERRRSDG